MTSSMTGYGEAEGQVNGVTYAVEIKTVNNRYFKTALKLPDVVAFLEGEIDKLLRENLARGTVNCSLRIKNAPAEALFEIDEKVLAQVVEKLGRASNSAGVNTTVDIGNVLGLPGIVVPAAPDRQQAQLLREGILEITKTAIDRLRQTRAAEGSALAKVLLEYCEAIKRYLERIRPRNTEVLQQYAERLRKRVDEMLANAGVKLDEQTLAREVAVFAERSDISEEIGRLEYHLQQFVESCEGSGPSGANEQVGRRLEFISQEMLREANTLASKAANAEISGWVVEIKCLIDRIKEQVANVE
jgi:uncharacterized protein (TIGR00255 family)